jgi:hypothetical protein
MNLSISSANPNPTRLEMKGSQRPIFQNLGPATLYFSTDTNNIASSGIKMPMNAVYEMPAELSAGAGAIFFVAVSTDPEVAQICDVRYLNVG